MATLDEIAPDVYKITIYTPASDMQFNHFLVKDEQPLLYHTGSRQMFPQVLEAIRRIMQPAELRWISFSHFESDECSALNEWLQAAPRAQAVATVVAVRVNLADFALRESRALAKDEELITGRYRFRMIPTPHLPHGWDAGMLFEQVQRILFCSDLFHQFGDVEAVSHASLIERARQVLMANQNGPLRCYMPYTSKTDAYMRELADLKPQIIATQHGSAFAGDGSAALLELAGLIKDVYENYG